MLLRPGWWFAPQPNTLLKVSRYITVIWHQSASGYILVNHWIHNSSQPPEQQLCSEKLCLILAHTIRGSSLHAGASTTHVTCLDRTFNLPAATASTPSRKRSKSVTLPWHGNRLLHTTLKMVAGRVETMEWVKGKAEGTGPRLSGQSTLCRVQIAQINIA